jgi:hypothetical protein
MFWAGPVSTARIDAASGAGRRALVLQAPGCAEEGWALSRRSHAGPARPQAGIGRPLVDSRGVAQEVDLAAQWACLRLFAEAVAP